MALTVKPSFLPFYTWNLLVTTNHAIQQDHIARFLHITYYHYHVDSPKLVLKASHPDHQMLYSRWDWEVTVHQAKQKSMGTYQLSQTYQLLQIFCKSHCYPVMSAAQHNTTQPKPCVRLKSQQCQFTLMIISGQPARNMRVQSSYRVINCKLCCLHLLHKLLVI